MNHTTVIETPTWRVSNDVLVDGKSHRLKQTFNNVEDAKTAYAAAVNDPRSTWVMFEQFQKLAECNR